MRNRALLFAAFAAMTTAAPAVAQNPALVRRLDSIAAAATRAEARLQAHDDNMDRLMSTFDTVVVRSLRILVERRHAGVVRVAAEAAFDSLAPRMGGTLGRLAGYVVVASEDPPMGPDDTTVTMTFETRPRVLLPQLSTGGREEDMRGALLRVVPFIVFFDASPDFVRWMGNQVPVDTIVPAQWRRIRMDLVSTPAIVGPRCYGGDLASCERALQLVPAKDPLIEWYDGRGWRRLVQSWGRHAANVDREAFDSCMIGSDLACLTVMRKRNENEIPPAMGAEGRASLARLAMTMGGDGAIERMLAGDRSVPPMRRLAAASRVSEDSLVSEWQQRVHETVAPSQDLSPEVVLVAGIWSLGLGLVSLRSPRWR